MSIKAFDHVAIPIAEVDAMLSFYRQLGFAVHGFEEDGLQYYAVHFM